MPTTFANTFANTFALTAPAGCASLAGRGPVRDAGNGAMTVVFAGRRAR
jgi:hypothetical protein